MKIRLLTITHKMPSWITEGCNDYTKRLPATCSLEIIEIAAEKRGANPDIERIKIKEGKKLLAAIKPGNHIVALDVKGKLLSTEQLAKKLDGWQQLGQNVDLLVGGPDGLSEECIKKANSLWSLSPLTFPHLIVRLIVSEQIYRAWSILQNHPYHR